MFFLARPVGQNRGPYFSPYNLVWFISPQSPSSDMVVTLQEQSGELSREHLERLYVFALMWSTGALLELEDRRKMELWLRGNDSICLNLPDIPPDSEDTMFDYYVTADGNHAFMNKCQKKYRIIAFTSRNIIVQLILVEFVMQLHFTVPVKILYIRKITFKHHCLVLIHVNVFFSRSLGPLEHQS